MPQPCSAKKWTPPDFGSVDEVASFCFLPSLSEQCDGGLISGPASVVEPETQLRRAAGKNVPTSIVEMQTSPRSVPAESCTWSKVRADKGRT